MKKIAGIQMSMSDNKSDNINKATSFIREASKNGAEIICLPELYSSRYFCQEENTGYFSLAEDLNGESLSSMQKLSKELNVSIVVPYFEKRAIGLYHNSLIVFENGNNLGMYRKMHIPDDPSYYEKFYFTEGDLGYKSFDTKGIKLGTLICWDQWYPEAARLTALKGAQLIHYPTAIGWLPSEKAELGEQQKDAWVTVQRGHAIANGLYVISVNRVGFEKNSTSEGIEFWGNSFICDPQGKILAKAGIEEEIIYAEIDLQYLESIRQWWPFFRDRRIDSFNDLTKRYSDE